MCFKEKPKVAPEQGVQIIFQMHTLPIESHKISIINNIRLLVVDINPSSLVFAFVVRQVRVQRSSDDNIIQPIPVNISHCQGIGEIGTKLFSADILQVCQVH